MRTGIRRLGRLEVRRTTPSREASQLQESWQSEPAKLVARTVNAARRSMTSFDIRYYTREQREARKAKAQADAQARELRSKILLIVQNRLPRQPDMKARQRIVDSLVNDLIEALDNKGGGNNEHQA